MIVGDILEVKLAAWFNGQIGLNVRHYRVAAVAGTTVTTRDVATLISSNMAPLYRALMTDLADFLGVSVRNISPVPAESSQTSSSGGGQGDISDDPLPTQTAGIITLRTAFAGRAFRGRVYVPFPAEADNDLNDRPGTAYMIALTLLADELITPYVVTVGPDSVTIDPGVLTSVPSFAPFVGHTPRNAWATQRRRGTFGASNPKEIPL